MLRIAACSLSFAFIVLGVACQTDEESPPVDSKTPGSASADESTPLETAPTMPSPSATPDDVVVVSHPLWAFENADSLGTLLFDFEIPLIGKVEEVALPYDPRPGFGGVSPEVDDAGGLPSKRTPTDEEINRAPGRLYTVFRVTVIDPGASPLVGGQTVYVGQSGGMWEGTVYQDSGNSLLSVGQIYLLAIMPHRSVANYFGEGYFLGSPFAVFRVTSDGVLEPLDENWANKPAVRALVGRDPETALDLILAALPATSSSHPEVSTAED